MSPSSLISLFNMVDGRMLATGIVTAGVTPTSTNEGSRNLPEWSRVSMDAG